MARRKVSSNASHTGPYSCLENYLRRSTFNVLFMVETTLPSREYAENLLRNLSPGITKCFRLLQHKFHSSVLLIRRILVLAQDAFDHQPQLCLHALAS